MKMKKSLKSVLLLSAVFLTACGNETTESEDTSESQATIEMEDTAGHQVSIPANPKRLAVFDNGQLDLLSDLGLEDRVVVTATENYPSHLESFSDLPIAGTLHEVDLEITNSEDPDLAIVAGRSRESFDGLNEFVPTIDLSNNSDNIWDSIQVNLDYYSELFDLEEETNQLKEDLSSQLTELQDKTEDSDLTTLFLMTNEGSLSAYGENSRFGFVHDLFGFTPIDKDIESSRHGMDVSYEYVLDQDPDVIFVVDRIAAVGGEDTTALTDNALIQETTAYKNDNIITLSPDIWYLSEGGTTAFSKMIEEVSVVFE